MCTLHSSRRSDIKLDAICFADILTFPRKAAQSLDSLISYLTRKHTGYVCKRGFVSYFDLGSVKVLPALSDDSYFMSQSKPGP
jgi:hypothetical protein